MLKENTAIYIPKLGSLILNSVWNIYILLSFSCYTGFKVALKFRSPNWQWEPKWELLKSLEYISIEWSTIIGLWTRFRIRTVKSVFIVLKTYLIGLRGHLRPQFKFRKWKIWNFWDRFWPPSPCPTPFQERNWVFDLILFFANYCPFPFGHD